MLETCIVRVWCNMNDWYFLLLSLLLPPLLPYSWWLFLFFCGISILYNFGRRWYYIDNHDNGVVVISYNRIRIDFKGLLFIIFLSQKLLWILINNWESIFIMMKKNAYLGLSNNWTFQFAVDRYPVIIDIFRFESTKKTGHFEIKS